MADFEDDSRIISTALAPEDHQEGALRPERLDDFVGQERHRENLRVFIEAARQRGEALDHCLFHGPPGLGKTTLAHILARELGSQIRVTSGPVLEKPADLAGLLTNLNDRDILFVDEVHRLGKVVEEYLYPAMEDFRLDILLDRGAAARSVQLGLPRFTLVGATTRAGLLSSPLMARFGIVVHLEHYSQEELATILARSARLLEIDLAPEAALELSGRCRGTPRIANRLLRRLRDFAQVKGEGRVTLDIARYGLERLEVDEAGLDRLDRRFLGILMEHFQGGPTGLGTLAVALGEEEDTLEEVLEPFLVKEGFLQRTPRGRVATPKAWTHLGLGPRPSSGEALLPF
ncbi:MAG: Holliday junction branch migration DNA helicase RuvB [bacterium]|jgi:Holliday junction DNA helicase RuvB|nr:Holliday junction branch migration DNA helicase RuvB [bacterium]